MSLAAQGFRFWVSPDRKRAEWRHPAEPPPVGWADCTDMNDAEFAQFMLG